MKKSLPKCIDYSRVSSERQYTDGSGIESQCRSNSDFADSKGWTIIKSFQDVYTGTEKKAPRKQLEEALNFLEAYPEPLYLIVSELDRFARNLLGFYNLKERVTKAGGILIDVEGRILQPDQQDDPEAFLLEANTASNAEYQSRKNREKVISRQKSHLMDGYYIFTPPCGYTNGERINGRTTIIHHEINALIVKRMLEKLAWGEITTQCKADAFLVSQGLVVASSGKPARCSHNRIPAILKQLDFYAGYVSFTKWEIERRQGRHPALIDKKTFQRIEARLPQLRRNPTRKQKSHDAAFPLLRHVYCAECEGLMRSSPSRGKQGKIYHYYVCKNKACACHGKNVKAEYLHKNFTQALSALGVSDIGEVNMPAFVEEELMQWLKHVAQRNRKLYEQVRQLNTRQEKLANKLANSELPPVVEAIERQIIAADKEKQELQKRIELEDLSDSQQFELLGRISRLFDDLGCYWNEATLDERRQLQGCIKTLSPLYQTGGRQS